MSGILLPAGCCCEHEENSCDDCETEYGNTDQFTVAFSSVARCTGCYAHTYGGYVNWETPPSPALSASYVLNQAAPDPGGGCIWRYEEDITGAYAFYGGGGSSCASWIQRRSLEKLFIELRINLNPTPLRMKLIAYYWKPSVSTSVAHIFNGTTITPTPCFGTTVINNTKTTCVDTGGYTVWGSGTSGSYINGQATVDVVVP